MQTDKTDARPMAWVWDLPAALVLLTRLPVPALPDHAFSNPARAVWAYPIVGLCLAMIVGGLAWLCDVVGLSAPITAGLVLGALILLTGAMHEDGLADSADGLWGGNDPARRLDIMKDSRSGTYGVLALILAMGLRWIGLSEAAWPAILTALVLSRAIMPPVMLALPHARSTGLSHSVGAPPMGRVVLGLGIGTAIAVVATGGMGLVALVLAGAVAGTIGLIARSKIGGQTGDILGATQICTEIAVLIVLMT
jgi:adenosylcobinamide-GDP ribazoletransferase